MKSEKETYKRCSCCGLIGCEKFNELNKNYTIKIDKKFITKLKQEWRFKCKRMDIMSSEVAIFELESLLNDLGVCDE